MLFTEHTLILNSSLITSSLVGWGVLLDRMEGLGLSGGGASAADYPHVSGRRPERTKAFGLTGHFYADFTLPEKLELFNKKKVGVCLEGC